MNKIIVTDLTRFSREEKKVCVAGIDVETGRCIRPMPYLEAACCKEWNMMPGGILSGHFKEFSESESPHIEDMYCENLKFHGHCSSEEFNEILNSTCWKGVKDGFGCEIADGMRVIHTSLNPSRSLITIRVHPEKINVIQDRYDEKGMRANFVDKNGSGFNFIPVNDFGFRNYAENHYFEDRRYLKVNKFIHTQNKVFLRLGLGRLHKAKNGEEGHWIQVNGIYTFPLSYKGVRSYE